MKYGKLLSNATSATRKHSEGPETNDLKTFILEMQDVITDLRKQVRLARANAVFTSLDLSPAPPRGLAFLGDGEGVDFALTCRGLAIGAACLSLACC